MTPGGQGQGCWQIQGQPGLQEETALNRKEEAQQSAGRVIAQCVGSSRFDSQHHTNWMWQQIPYPSTQQDRKFQAFSATEELEILKGVCVKI